MIHLPISHTERTLFCMFREKNRIIPTGSLPAVYRYWQRTQDHQHFLIFSCSHVQWKILWITFCGWCNPSQHQKCGSWEFQQWPYSPKFWNMSWHSAEYWLLGRKVTLLQFYIDISTSFIYNVHNKYKPRYNNPKPSKRAKCGEIVLTITIR